MFALLVLVIGVLSVLYKPAPKPLELLMMSTPTAEEPQTTADHLERVEPHLTLNNSAKITETYY